MILIQSQLCSIDQSDLFIPRSRGGGGGGWKSIRHLLLFFLFFFFSHSASLFPACLSSSGCARVYTTYVAGGGEKKPPPVKSNWPRRTRQSFFTGRHVQILLFARMLYFSSGVCLFFLVCLVVFFFAPYLCPLPPSPPPRLAPSTARHRDTPAMLKPARGGQVTRTGARLPCPSAEAPGLGAIIKANSPPHPPSQPNPTPTPTPRLAPGSRGRSETGKVKSVQCLNTFRCRICLDLVYRLTLSIFCLTGNCWCAFPLSARHESERNAFLKIAKFAWCLAREQLAGSTWLTFQWLRRRSAGGREKTFCVKSAGQTFAVLKGLQCKRVQGHFGFFRFYFFLS